MSYFNAYYLSGADPLCLRRSPLDPLRERSSPRGSALTQSPRRGRTIETGRNGDRKERTGRVGGSSAELVPRRFGRPRFETARTGNADIVGRTRATSIMRRMLRARRSVRAMVVELAKRLPGPRWNAGAAAFSAERPRP